MATSNPQVYGPDGILRDVLVFTTTLDSRFFTGVASSSTVDIEVSIRGGAYTSDPDFVQFDGTTWTIPNPAAFPDGLDLQPGSNQVFVRAVLSNGSVSSPAVLDIRYVQSSDLGVVASIPTNVTLDQLDISIRVTVDGIESPDFRGINFYASTEAGGGNTGYRRINLSTVSSSTTMEELTDIGSFDVEAEVATNPDGSMLSDPQYVRYLSTQVDADGEVFQTDFTEQVEIPESTQRIRSSVALQSVRVVRRFSFEHSRTARPNSTPPTVFVNAFAALQVTDPLYYVVTGVFYNAIQLIEFESAFSVEVVGHPLAVSTAVGNFPVVQPSQIRRGVMDAIARSNPQVKMEPGSYIRDVFIDPFVAESARIRFIVNFLHSSQSFAGLLQIDDPNNTGASIPVASSPYKTGLKAAFGLYNDADVQAVIDRAFESLAGNRGVFRRPGQASRGQVTFFTTKRPTQTLPVAVGATASGGSVTFRVTQGASIPLEQLASYYDPVRGRWQVTVSVQATQIGSVGNVAAGQVKKSAITGLSVVNTADMFGGKDQETNRELAVRAQNAIASVDSGTKRGYLQTAADVAGVVQVNVVSAGDPLMQRDLNAEGVHKGGKVDVWIRGQNLAEVTDTFAFGFDIATDVHFVPIGPPSNLIFQAVDSALSPTTPIVALLDDVSAGYTFRNASTGAEFDLTGYTLLSYNTVQLSKDVVQPPVDLTDVVLGDYRRRTGSTFVLPKQPVRVITSVAGTLSGTLPSSTYALYTPAAPTLTGRSVLAGDFVQITPVENGGVFTPSGGSVSVLNEPHVLIGEYIEYLDALGANPLTIVVTSTDGLITYRGPNDPSGISDYTVVSGTETIPVAVQRTTTGDITSGQTVLISYQHEENFTVTYKVNNIVKVLQEVVDAKKHITADVLVKDAVEVPIDIGATVILVRGAQKSTVDSLIRTNLANYFSGLALGQPLRQSDVVGVIESTTGVSFVELPITKLVRSPGSLVVKESLATDQPGDSTYLSWSNPTVSVWLIEDSLSSATTNGGGPVSTFRGVFQDEQVLTLVTSATPATLTASVGCSYIIGSQGISITGLSDDATLMSQGYNTPTEREARRAFITGNRVLVSTSVDDSPTRHKYDVTYIVGVDSGTKNIVPGDAEYLVVGPGLDFTFDEDR